MTRPDPRLLCPVDALPFVPAGFPLWEIDTDTPCVAGELMVPTECPGWTDLLDFSAPAIREGLPVRLDALPWGLRVLGWAPKYFINGAGTLTLGNGAVVGPRDKGHVTIEVDPWPDLSNLSPDDASRAVVVAALKARKVKP